MRGKAQRDGRPAIRWMETFTRSGHGVKNECGIIQAIATETVVQAQDKPWVTWANH